MKSGFQLLIRILIATSWFTVNLGCNNRIKRCDVTSSNMGKSILCPLTIVSALFSRWVKPQSSRASQQIRGIVRVRHCRWSLKADKFMKNRSQFSFYIDFGIDTNQEKSYYILPSSSQITFQTLKFDAISHANLVRLLLYVNPLCKVLVLSFHDLAL